MFQKSYYAQDQIIMELYLDNAMMDYPPDACPLTPGADPEDYGIDLDPEEWDDIPF